MLMTKLVEQVQLYHHADAGNANCGKLAVNLEINKKKWGGGQA